MREIKFRTWDDGIKAMRHYDFLFTSQVKEFGVCDWTIDRLMQFTGLHDKNGKEIYEGDVLRKKGHKRQVIFNEGVFWAWEQNGQLELYLFAEQIDNTVEIIGNIYQHPELLNPQP